ncbi:MAG: hypothetical protein A3G81_24465 [Betaproteobacteria bacterium RIFCSPLOWO2_12_FULL_65_14]|nr:MAG: hypothetical protein A3G81_24465 [Betaproteobacteria bacterium RIFCSPLOWO2_12_FULL_65_14]
MDLGQQVSASDTRCQATAFARVPGAVVNSAGGLNAIRDALVIALRDESDRIQTLRRILDAGHITPSTAKCAAEALDHAEQLLAEERRAWRALVVLSRRDQSQCSTAQRPNKENQWWPRSLEDVAAEVRALTDTVRALQVLSRTSSHRGALVSPT